jgi:hypothetical protein
MLSQEQIDSYHANGYVGVENVISSRVVEELRRVTDEFVERSREVTEHTAVFDLEPGHSREHPKLRRLKSPILQHEVYRDMLGHEGILAPVSQLIGYGLRCNGDKLNMKLPEVGSPVEWHQDWAFYPHTNDDILAVGVCIDAMTEENGGMLVVPGSHRGPLYDHHQDGFFVGAITDSEVDREQMVQLEVPAGGISLHHVRTAHGSVPNRSPRPRRLLLLEMCAIDSWPLVNMPDLEAFNARILRGSPTLTPRMEAAPVRIPLPSHERRGSIYEVQSKLAQPVLAGAR